MPQDDPDWLRAVQECRDRPGFLQGLAGLLEQAGRTMSERGFRCMGGGCCCKFDLAPFRLFLSTGELALLTARRPPSPQNLRWNRCPYQVGPRCAAHALRPLGCRTYFCDPRAPSAMADVYEAAHASIRLLHESNGLNYLYVELVNSLCLAFPAGAR